MRRQTDRYPAVSFPPVSGNRKLLVEPFPAAAFLVGRTDSAAKNHKTTGVPVLPSAALARSVEGVEMKVVCSFSLLLRLALGLAGSALVAGVALSHPEDTAPVERVTPVVVAHGEEVR
jgi:hypothetical protein